VRGHARARRISSALALVGGAFVVLASCGPRGPAPTNDAECRAAAGCRQSGQCTFNRSTKKCIVGSNKDCADSVICGTQNRCIQVGETCGKEAGQ
jgi:hypothetical protein